YVDRWLHYPSCLTHAAPPAIHTLSLHDALPICDGDHRQVGQHVPDRAVDRPGPALPPGRHRLGHAAGPPLQAPGLLDAPPRHLRSEEHTSELQSRENLVCRLLLEKKKTDTNTHI